METAKKEKKPMNDTIKLLHIPEPTHIWFLPVLPIPKLSSHGLIWRTQPHLQKSFDTLTAILF
jgi:hypothetical protein